MSAGSFALHFDHEIDAPRVFVWRAWTEPAQLTHWYRPDSAWSLRVAEVDLRESGAYRFGLKPPGRPLFYEVGQFREVRYPQRLVYTMRFEGLHLHELTGEQMEDYETIITAAFAEVARDRTRVLVTHDGYRSEHDRARHCDGWPRFLDHLTIYCTGGAME